MREEASGDDRRYLTASLSEAGDLTLEGQDLGPSTSIVSSDGEYEWLQTVRVEHLLVFRHRLGIDEAEDLLDSLARNWNGARSYDLEAVLRSGDVPCETFII